MHGYCSIKCPIGICEKAFNPQPWGGGGTPAWIAAIIKHELEHKKQINPGPPPSWTKTKAEREYDAWQAALKCAETSGLSKIEKDKIIAIKEYWSNVAKAEKAEAESLVMSEWEHNFVPSLPGNILLTNLVVRNYADTPKAETILITNQKSWLIEPNIITVFLEPDQTMSFPIIVHVPDTAKINSKNELFSVINTPGGPVSDFMFVMVNPSVTVTPGPNIMAHRGEGVTVSFMVENNIHSMPDTVLIELTNSLDWPIYPPSFEAILMPGEQFTISSTLVVPPMLPYWTTNLVFCRATSVHHPQQTDQRWLSAQIMENDISALLIDTPLGSNTKESMITPAAWAFNTGMENSFFDFFVEIDFPSIYRDSIKGLYLPPGHDMLFFFNPLTLNQIGQFKVKFYTRAMCCDADPGNDTVRGNFTVTRPDQIFLQNVYVHPGEEHCYEASQSITTGGPEGPFIVDNGAVVHLVAGQEVTLLPTTSFHSGSNVHAFIDQTGLYCNNPLKLIEAGNDIVKPELSISETPKEKTFFRIYPNPTSGKLTLELSNTTKLTPVIVEVYGMMGEKILREEFTAQTRYELSLALQTPGVYLLRVISGMETRTVKVIKQ